MMNRSLPLLVLFAVLSIAHKAPWPNQFSISFLNKMNDGTFSFGMLYYNWELNSQRIDHSPNTHECAKFYHTNESCSILWTSNQMYALTQNTNGTWDCCMEKPNKLNPITKRNGKVQTKTLKFKSIDLPIGALIPNWVEKGTNYTGEISCPPYGSCNHWETAEQTFYASLKHKPYSPYFFTFPSTESILWFNPESFYIVPQPTYLFNVPTNCTQKCASGRTSRYF